MHRQIYGYEHFNHAHIIKEINGELLMTYGEAMIQLSHPEKALYSVQTLYIEF
jgi:hypothetical protein